MEEAVEAVEPGAIFVFDFCLFNWLCFTIYLVFICLEEGSAHKKKKKQKKAAAE